MGNLCRSPMAAALFHARVPTGRCSVVSSGLAAQPGRPIDPPTAALLEKRGLPVLAPAARMFDPAALGPDDLVLAMQRRHLQALRALAPEARARMHLLGRWSRSQEIDDPIAGTQDDIEKTFTLIERCVSQWCAHDRRLSA
ncbi:arsenate reductase/protein-tyrosine-phosphatase family protein [Pseudoxanthomonas mexicana]